MCGAPERTAGVAELGTVELGGVQCRGLLQKKVRFETYVPVGTFPRGWYVYMIFHDIYTDFYTVSEVG